MANETRIRELRNKIKQIEKEQDIMGVSGFNYSRKDRAFGRDWEMAKRELKELGLNSEEKGNV